MKRWNSLLLVIMLLTSVLPIEALAAEDTFTLSLEETQRVIRKAGASSDTWHEGMSWSDSMSAYQKFCYLTDFRDTVATPLKNRYVMAAGKAGSNQALATEAEDYSLSNIQEKVFLMESKLNHFVFDLETEVDAVTSAETLIADDDASASEKATAYRRIQKAETRLEEISK